MKTNRELWKQYKNIINTVVKPALGCTEPIAAAYAAAVAADMLTNEPKTLDVKVSDNLYKNAMGVFVPGTGKIGLPIAAAAGAVFGNPDSGLEVLAGITKADVLKAQQLIDNGNVTVARDLYTSEFIYCSVVMSDGINTAEVILSGGHTQIIKKILNGNVIFVQDTTASVSTGNLCDGIDISIEKIYQYAMQEDFDEIKFILDAAEINTVLSNEGLDHAYGLEVARTMSKAMKEGYMADDLVNDIVMRTVAASDARMGGATLPAMSNFGSGNQGVAATIPIVIAAKYFKASEEILARALIMSHLVAIYIKSHYPPLSAFCGNTVTSGAAAMAMVYLAGGTFKQGCYAIQNVISDCSGMICDGAKSTCAMKVKTSTSAACTAFLMAIHKHDAHEQGIVADDVEKSINNIGKLVTQGMRTTDTTIIEIMAS